MKKNKKKNQMLVTTLSIGIIIITLCFLILLIKYDTLKNGASSFKIEVTKVERMTPIKAGNISPKSNESITDNGLSLDMSVNLYHPNDEITYIVTVKNTSDIKGKIVNIISQPDYIDNERYLLDIYPAKVVMNNISGKILSPGESATIKITFSYGIIESETYNAINIPYKISLLTQTV